MEIKNMSIAEIEARLAEMKAQIESAESEEQLNKMKEAFTEERKLLSERKAELVELETRKAEAKAITEGTMVPKVIEERKEETNMKKVEEYRNSKEYIDAFAEFLKTGKPDECRALLTTNVGEAGEVAIPDLVSDIIKTDWVQSELLSLVKTIEVPGNYIQQFEVSAGDAEAETPVLWPLHVKS